MQHQALQRYAEAMNLLADSKLVQFGITVWDRSPMISPW